VLSSGGPLAARRLALTYLAGVAACATGPGSSGSQAAPGAAAAAWAPAAPPAGTQRLPWSIYCEPEPQPACDADCVIAHGGRSGSLDKEVIRAEIRAHLAEVTDCYDGFGLAFPEAKGAMRVKFGIAPSGAVQTSCLVSSELNAPPMDRCVLDRLLNWAFPAPEGGGWVIVTYPFVFTR
jgi:hypothetical protein